MRSQHALIINAVTIVFTMAMMGYARSASRVHWHIYGVMEDTTPHAFSPALGQALLMSALSTFLFFFLVGIVIWVTIRASRYAAFSTQYFFLAPLVLWAVSLTEKTAAPAGQVSERPNHLWKALASVCGLLIAFVYMGYSVPQMASLPPKKEVFDPSQINTKADLVAQGKKLFFGKGQCSLCHSIAPTESSRAPIMRGIGAKLSKEFLIKSLLEPESYIYIDYTPVSPKPFPSQMPAINKPPIDLNMPEILMVVAFLQSLGGEVTVEPQEVKALIPATEPLEAKELIPATFAEDIGDAN